LATAKALTARGAKVGLGDLDSALVRAEARAFGGHGAELDVRDPASFAAFLKSTEKALGPIDVLVNNAGVMSLGPFLKEDLGVSDLQIDINFRGVIHGARLALPGMVSRGRGHLINIASLGGRFALPGAAVYSATKFAVVGFTEALRRELEGSGVFATVILPSRISTELVAGTEEGHGVPTARPEDVADAVLHALRHRTQELTVPRYLAGAAGWYGVLPSRAQRWLRRRLRDDRLLTRLDREKRLPYERRLAALAAGPKTDGR
jgi:NADP-dependent 3-hydroxy acid dehydrogenase YdfG